MSNIPIKKTPPPTHTHTHTPQIDLQERTSFTSLLSSTPLPTPEETSLLTRSLAGSDLSKFGVRNINSGGGGRAYNTPKNSFGLSHSGPTRATTAAERKRTWRREPGCGTEWGVKRFTKFLSGDSTVYAKGTAAIHTGKEDVLAYLWNYCGVNRMKGHQRKEGNMMRQ